MFVRFGNNTDTQQDPPDGQKVEILSVYTPQPSQGSVHDCLIAAQDVEVALSKSQNCPIERQTSRAMSLKHLRKEGGDRVRPEKEIKSGGIDNDLWSGNHLDC
jgi:hypothetical protein